MRIMNLSAVQKSDMVNICTPNWQAPVFQLAKLNWVQDDGSPKCDNKSSDTVFPGISTSYHRIVSQDFWSTDVNFLYPIHSAHKEFS